MKIVVIGANGKAGKLIIEEARARGIEVKAFDVLDGGDAKSTDVIIKDLFDLNKADIRGYDALINAFGVWKPETMDLFQEAAIHLSDLVSNSEQRLIVMGSAGSLYVDDNHSEMFMETALMPDFAIPVAKAQAKVLSYLRQRNDVLWTYLSPPVDFRPEGAKIGSYQLGKDQMIFSSDNESQISYADYAIAIIDELENKSYLQQRFTVVAI